MGNVDQANAAITPEAPGVFEDAAMLQEPAPAPPSSAVMLQETVPAPGSSAAGLDPELIGEFIVESRDHLTNIEAQLLIVERDPSDSEALNSVFRGFHSIKGLAGFLELWDIQKLAHEVETVLDAARTGQLTLGPDGIDVILESADYLERWLQHLEAVLRNGPAAPPQLDEALLAAVAAIPAAQPTEVAQPLTPAAHNPAAPSRSQAAAIRVNTSKLDYLVDMAGEMVIAESLVRHDPEISGVRSPRLQRNIQQLTRITAELQKTAMAMRLVPIGPLFRRTERVVRDLARQFGKPVSIETQGDEIEFDRGIVEELADPLMHMVRNSLDHGIEPPDQRAARRQAGGRQDSAQGAAPRRARGD